MSSREDAWCNTTLTDEERSKLKHTTCTDCGEINWCQYIEGEEEESDDDDNTVTQADPEWVCEECYYAAFF